MQAASAQRLRVLRHCLICSGDSFKTIITGH